MPKLLPLLAAFLCCTVVSCSGVGKTDKPFDAVEKTDSCRQDAGNTYEVFVPATVQPNDPLPLLVIVDAHGAGKFALAGFKSAAKKYRVMLVASNTIKNGFTDYNRALQLLIDDVRQKYPVNKTLFLTGFSGGARMALNYATTHPTDGLILCGALAAREQLSALSCPVMSISGMDDFNFPETAQYLFQEQSLPPNLKIELSRASHSWPDSLMLGNAVGYLRLQLSNATKPSADELSAYVQMQQSRIDVLKKSGDLLRATLIARNMSQVPAFDPNGAFATTYNALKSDKIYLSQLQQLGNCLRTEMSARQTYVDAFNNKDISWWNHEIQTVNQAITTERDSFTVDMYRRIKGFWGIACYSLCKQAVAQQNTETLQKTLSIYKAIEPENPDMFYFSAFPYLWKNDRQNTITALRQALKFGFTDMNQLKNDFPKEIWSGL